MSGGRREQRNIRLESDPCVERRGGVSHDNRHRREMCSNQVGHATTAVRPHPAIGQEARRAAAGAVLTGTAKDMSIGEAARDREHETAEPK